ncbi:MAG: HAD family hydrolase, partial [Muribaculaceae bacterium]|nr:HAD family hydrolase [Muribaculaceae bacterium]
MKSLVIFDLDGTLLNTIDDLGTAVNHALNSMGYPVHAISSYPSMVGNGVRKLISRALPAEARNPQIIDRMLVHFRDFYDVHCTDLTTPYPGIEKALSYLSAQGISLAVTSNKYQTAVTKIVNHYFPEANWKAVLGNKAGMPPKPDPSIVFEALNLCPTPKKDVLYIGDSGVDIETARRACIESVGVTWGFRDVRELRDNYADHIISDPDEI